MAEPASEPDSFQKGIDRLRETAKWVVTLFAGVGAVLGAGTQLSSIGRLDAGDWANEHRIGVAVAAGALTLVCIGVVIHRAVRVLTVGDVNLFALSVADQQYVQTNKLLGEGLTLSEAWEKVNALVAQRATTDPANAAQMSLLNTQIDYYDRLLERTKSVLRYRTVGHQFWLATWVLLVAGALAATGFVVFVWATNPPEPVEQAPEFRLPVVAAATLSEDDQARLEASLGAACVEREVSVVVLSVQEERADVVSLPEGGCPLNRFSMPVAGLNRTEAVSWPDPPPVATPGT